MPGEDFEKIVSTASSYHPAGSQAVLCDGSVAMYSATIDPIVWTAYGTRQGAETVMQQ